MHSSTPVAIALSLFLVNGTPAHADAGKSSEEGNSSQSRTVTQAVADDSTSNINGRPDTPSGLSASINNTSQVELSWTPQAKTIEGYNIYRDNAYHGTVRDTSFTDRNVTVGERYTYSLVAFTADDRYSLHSSKIDVEMPHEEAAAPGSAGVSTHTESAGSKAASTDATEEPDTASSGGIPSGYNLVFSDEFNASSLDTSKWDSKYRWGPEIIVNNEAQYYVDQLSNPDFGHQPFQFDGENLIIHAIPTPDFLRSSASDQPYLSGALTTHGKFRMRYGYIEMRAKLPAGKGLWPAFWMLHQQNDGIRPEIDIVEYIGDKRSVAYNTYHWYENNANLKSTPTYQASGPDYSQGFHTFGVRWEPGKLTWYVDGVERNTYSGGSVASEDMYLLLNLALGGSWAGNPDGSTPFPAKLVVDYIRAYQL